MTGDGPVTVPVMTKRYQAPPADSTISSVLGSNSRPVSSSTSRWAASAIVSPASIRPAGRYHWPAHELHAHRTHTHRHSHTQSPSAYSGHSIASYHRHKMIPMNPEPYYLASDGERVLSWNRQLVCLYALCICIHICYNKIM